MVRDIGRNIYSRLESGACINLRVRDMRHCFSLEFLLLEYLILYQNHLLSYIEPTLGGHHVLECDSVLSNQGYPCVGPMWEYYGTSPCDDYSVRHIVSVDDLIFVYDQTTFCFT